jgi:hypothetical protein
VPTTGRVSVADVGSTGRSFLREERLNFEQAEREACNVSEAAPRENHLAPPRADG